MKKRDTEFCDYLQIHYGDPDIWWCMQPPMQRFWYKEDLDQYRSGTFCLTENEEKRRFRSYCLVLAECADRMYREGRLRADEVHAIYDVLFALYMNRQCPAEYFIPAAGAERPFE